jgi:hypothetical protein
MPHADFVINLKQSTIDSEATKRFHSHQSKTQREQHGQLQHLQDTRQEKVAFDRLVHIGIDQLPILQFPYKEINHFTVSVKM